MINTGGGGLNEVAAGEMTFQTRASAGQPVHGADDVAVDGRCQVSIQNGFAAR